MADCAEAFDAAAKVIGDRLRSRGISVWISGVDGSGKTTLGTLLVRELNARGIPSTRKHIYRWYLNVLAVPLLMVANRYAFKRLLVFDRNLYDNLAVLAARRPAMRKVCISLATVLNALLPRPDLRFYLCAGWDETLIRRPELSEEQYAELTSAYRAIIERGAFKTFTSGADVFGEVARTIVDRFCPRRV